MPKSVKPVRIALLLIEGFSAMSYASLVEPFRAAITLAGKPLYQWVHVSAGTKSIASSSGLTIPADMTIEDDPQCDMLFALSAGDPESFADRRVFAWLRRMDRKGMVTGGVSGGPYLLARAGLLAGYRATIHWEHAPSLREEFPDLALEPSLYVIDRRRMTCAGGTAALDLALALIERDYGKALATQVGEWFIRTEPRHADIGQRPGRASTLATAPPALRTMLSLMEEHVEEPLDRAELARLSGISLRQLERQCRHWTGAGIAETFMQIRLDRGAELLRATNMPVTDIALACGFKTSSHFSRRYRERYGTPPGSISERKPV